MATAATSQNSNRLSRGIRRGRFPLAGEQFVDLVVLHRGQACEHVTEIFLRIEATSPAADQDRVNHRAAPSRLGMANKPPASPPQGCRPDGLLHQVVVDLKAPIAQISVKAWYLFTK